MSALGDVILLLYCASLAWPIATFVLWLWAGRPKPRRSDESEGPPDVDDNP